MSRLVAPTALRIPISAFLSLTEMNMMFAITTAPTTRDTREISIRKMLKVDETFEANAITSVGVTIVKSSSTPGARLCLSLSNILTSLPVSVILDASFTTSLMFVM